MSFLIFKKNISSSEYLDVGDFRFFLLEIRGKHVFKEVPGTFGVALRLRKNCSDQNFLEGKI